MTPIDRIPSDKLLQQHLNLIKQRKVGWALPTGSNLVRAGLIYFFSIDLSSLISLIQIQPGDQIANVGKI